MKSNYTHLFFDLDHTLWDFERNAAETLKELYEDFDLHRRGVPSVELFISVYEAVNEKMWVLYRNDVISKDDLRTVRYQKVLKRFDIHDEELALQVGERYMTECPQKTNVFDGAFELLDYLKPKYELHIITNGFEEIQPLKMKSSGLDQYFDKSITSERAGAKKPSELIFNYALELTGASIDTSLMIGDTLEADIVGARNIGMDQVYFNPKKTPHKELVTLEISHLLELKSAL